MEDNNYYVYLHIRSTDGTPFYVGRGTKNRSISKLHRSKHWHNIVNKYDYDVIFLEVNLTIDEANEKEIYWIKRIGRKDLNQGPLVNFTDGGEGCKGLIYTDEMRLKASNRQKGKSPGNKGLKASDEIKEKLSIAAKKRWTDEEKQKESERKKVKKCLKNSKII